MPSTFNSVRKSQNQAQASIPADKKIAYTDWNGLLDRLILPTATEYGALGNNIQDDTAFLQDMITSNAGKAVIIPPGSYKITDGLNVPAFTKVYGCGMGLTIINQTVPSKPVFVLANNADGIVIGDMKLFYVTAGNSGGDAIRFGNGNHWGVFQNLLIMFADTGFNMTQYACTSNFFNHIYIYQPTKYGIRVEGVLGQPVHIANQFNNFLVDGGTPGGLTSLATAISVKGAVESAKFSQAEIINCQNGVVVDTTGTRGVYDNEPTWCRFTDLVIDGNANFGIYIAAGQMNTWTSCIVTSTDSQANGAEGKGILVTTAWNQTFINCESSHNAGHGWVLEAGSKQTKLIGCSAFANGVVGGSWYGVWVVPNVTDFQIQGGQFTKTHGITAWGAASSQQYGVFIQTGTSDFYIVADNLVHGNLTAGIFDGGSGANKRVANNY